jgi:sugar phosphate isomerase/epimerase
MQRDDDDDIRRYFEYAKAAGMPMMVIGPSRQNLPRVEKFVKQYNIPVAIHNHGPEDKQFPTPESVLELIKGMDPRVGVCIDAGHTTRTGTNVLEAIRAAGARLLDFHIKDLKDLKDGKSQVPVGLGAMPVVEIFKLLKKMNYQGYVNLEYEIDAEDPLLGMAKSFAYMRGVLAGLRG